MTMAGMRGNRGQLRGMMIDLKEVAGKVTYISTYAQMTMDNLRDGKLSEARTELAIVISHLQALEEQLEQHEDFRLPDGPIG